MFDGQGYNITGPGPSSYYYGIYVYKNGTTLTNNKNYGVNVTLSAENCSFWKQDANGNAYIKGMWSGFVPGNEETIVEAIIPETTNVSLNVNVPKKVVDTLDQREEEVSLETSITIT